MRFAISSIMVAGLLLATVSDSSRGQSLYTLNVTGELYEIDIATGATNEVLGDLGIHSWSGLASAPGSTDSIYALHNPRPTTLEDPQFSRIVKLDVAAEMVTTFPFFDAASLGVGDVFSTGIAISPLAPEAAVLVGNDRSFPPIPHIWTVDLATGAVLDEARPLSEALRIESLTYSHDGSMLLATNQIGELVTIDFETAEVTPVGDPGLTKSITGIVINPANGQLLAIDGQGQDDLVVLDPSFGTLIREIGALGITGPEGLAFLVGETDPLDCDQDGAVDVNDLSCANALDITAALLDALNLLPGDLDGLGGVNFDDFIVFAENFGRPRGRYTEGDIDDSGAVDFEDFTIFAQNFGRRSMGEAEAPVPEPTTRLLLLMAGFSLACCNRHRATSRDSARI